MTTTLSEGVKVPDVGSTDWADDLETNWNLLNTALAQQGSWAKVDEAQTFTGVQTFSDGIVGSLQGTANMAMSDADGNTITSTYATKTELSTLSDTVGTKANDSDVVHKADAETITGAKTFSATVTSADVVPSATDTYSLGSASYQYNGIYGKSYFYNGVAWGLDRKNEWTNYQIMIGNPTVWYLRNDTVTLGTAPSSNRYLGMFFEDVNSTTLGYIALQVSKNGNNSIVFNLKNSDGTDTYVGGFRCTASPTGDYSLFPEGNASTDLGTPSNKWKTLNGINPGILGFPAVSYTTLDEASNWDKTGATENSYTATFDGYVELWCGRDNLDLAYITVTSAFWRQQTETTTQTYAILTFPVVKGRTYGIRILANSLAARILPCLGNV